MNLLQQLLNPKKPPMIDKQKEELEKYEAAAKKRMAKSEFERDRTARIATYLKCTEEGRDDCRIDISWEELARRGMGDGQD